MNATAAGRVPTQVRLAAASCKILARTKHLRAACLAVHHPAFACLPAALPATARMRRNAAKPLGWRRSLWLQGHATASNCSPKHIPDILCLAPRRLIGPMTASHPNRGGLLFLVNQRTNK